MPKGRIEEFVSFPRRPTVIMVDDDSIYLYSMQTFMKKEHPSISCSFHSSYEENVEVKPLEDFSAVYLLDIDISGDATSTLTAAKKLKKNDCTCIIVAVSEGEMVEGLPRFTRLISKSAIQSRVADILQMSVTGNL